mgnify:CR=1 FL=1|jgi:hypothetical protein
MRGVPWTGSAGRVRLRASDPPRDEGLEAGWRELGDRGMAFPERSLLFTIFCRWNVSFCRGMRPDCERLTRNVPRRRVPAEHSAVGLEAIHAVAKQFCPVGSDEDYTRPPAVAYTRGKS